MPDITHMAELYGADELPEDIYPLNYKLLQKEQQLDKTLLQKARKDPDKYEIKTFHGGSKKRYLIRVNDKIVVP